MVYLFKQADLQIRINNKNTWEKIVDLSLPLISPVLENVVNEESLFNFLTGKRIQNLKVELESLAKKQSELEDNKEDIESRIERLEREFMEKILEKKRVVIRLESLVGSKRN